MVFSHVQHKSALRLSNLFLERSVKQQAHYFSRLETRKIQLASCENRLETRFSKFSRIENRVSSRVSQLASDCQLTFERYCIVLQLYKSLVKVLSIKHSLNFILVSSCICLRDMKMMQSTFRVDKVKGQNKSE